MQDDQKTSQQPLIPGF